ncbi:MAG: FkbM family methyltransferase [Opitutaceae bacterium]|jgi:FkbM family methyltransferase
MLLSRHLKNAFRRVLSSAGYEIYRRPHLPKGTDAFESLRSHWPQWRPRVIFDVGANVGQTVERLRPLFPSATIHSFEPVPATFAALKTKTCGDIKVHCHALALADHAGETWIQLHESSDQNSLVPSLVGTTGASGPKVRLELDTLAAFCARQGITRIDLLKIDVEGFEMAVLQGAAPLLAAGAIDYIVVEAGLMPGNPRFTPLPELIDRLRPHGFWLIGVYEQYGCRYTQTAEFCNALFALEKHLTRDDRLPD